MNVSVAWEGRNGQIVTMACAGVPKPYGVPHVDSESKSGGNGSVLYAWWNVDAMVAGRVERVGGTWGYVSGSTVVVGRNMGTTTALNPTSVEVGGRTAVIESSVWNKKHGAYVNGTIGATSVGAVGAYGENSFEGSVYVYRDERLGAGGAGAALEIDVRIGTVEVVGQGSGVGEMANGDDPGRYRIVAWSSYGGAAPWFGWSVIYLEAAGVEVLLVGAPRDSTCGGLANGGGICALSGAVYVEDWAVG